MPLTAGTPLGSFEIVSPLGAGGMGEVYRARHLKLGRDVAIKVLPSDLASDPQRRHRFEREARATSALNHPNIVTIHDIDEHDGIHYIAMELVEGRTLRELLAGAPLPVGRLLALAPQIAEGLAKAHAAGIVHRDLKPENLMVTDDGLVKILDFGLAKLAPPSAKVGSDVTTVEQATRAGVVLGTVPYMSPEQAASRPVDFRSDQFSFGSILYEMATGRRAFRKDTTPQTLAAIIEGEPEPVGRLNRRLPAPLIAIIERCLAKDPEKRFASTRDLAAALQTVPERPAASPIRRRVFWTVAGLVAIGLAWALLPNASRLWRSLTPGASAPAIQAVAVLPLQNLSGDPEQEYFADGMTEALITDLARIGALKVISHSSAMRYKGTKAPLADIARELGVDALIEGSALRVGDRVRITAQLVDPRTQQALWADSYERAMEDVLRLQSQVAQAVAREIRITVTPEEQRQLASTRAVKPAVHEAYLKGMFYLNKLTPEGFERGLAHLNQAVAADAEDPLAHAGLALLYSQIGSHVPAPPPDAFSKARAAALRALELDDTLAEAHAALAQIQLYHDWDWPSAERSFKRALELNPNSAPAHAHYAWYLNLFGHQTEALAEMRKAQAVDPLTAIWTCWLGDLRWSEGRYDEALEHIGRALELDPDLPWAHYMSGLVHAAKGEYKEALAAHEKAVAGLPSLRASFGYYYALMGRRKEAREIAAEIAGAPGHGDALDLAKIHLALGEEDEAFRWLDVAYEKRLPFTPWTRNLPPFAPLRADPRFRELLQRMKLPV